MDSTAGKPMAKEQLMWLIKKGDLILSANPAEVKQVFTKAFSETDARNGYLCIYTYGHDDIPNRLANAENGKFNIL